MLVKNLLKYLLLVILSSISFGSLGHAFFRIESEEDIKSKSPGFIYLVGEEHDEEGDIDQSDLLKDFANEGRIILAFEGSSTEKNSDGTLFGLEQSEIHNMATSLGSMISVLEFVCYKKIVDSIGSTVINGEKISKKGYSKNFKSPGYTLDYLLGDINTYIRDTMLEKQDPTEISFLAPLYRKKLFQVLMKFHFGGDSSIMDHIGENTLDDNFYTNISDEYGDWYLLMKIIADYRQKVLNNTGIISEELSLKIKNELADLDSLYASMESAKQFSDWEVIFDKIFNFQEGIVEDVQLRLRNKIFLTKICSVYEETKNLGKPFFVLVGASHVPFLEKELSQKGYQVQINQRSIELNEDL